MRAVGLDLGERRVGVAISDDAGSVATPYEVIRRSGDLSSDRRRIARIVADVEAGIVVVGLPLSLDGSIGPAARAALEEVSALEEILDVPVTTHDERLTTVSADRQLQGLGLDAKRRRKMIDEVAASVMLQAWLDGQRAAERPNRPDGASGPGQPDGTAAP